MCPRSIAGVPSSQALPGCLITAPPSVYIPDVIGVLPVWIQKQNKYKTNDRRKHLWAGGYITMMISFNITQRCGSPTHLLPCFLLVSLVSLVHRLCGLSLILSLGWSLTQILLLILGGGQGLSPECALHGEYLSHNLDEHCLEDTG